MSINWGKPKEPKYLSILYGRYWDKKDFKFVNFRKTPLGWDFNIWRVMVSFDNYSNLQSNRRNKNAK